MNNSIKQTILCFFALCLATFSAQALAYTNSIGMEFVEIPAGCFMMGSAANSEDVDDSELPQHKVCIQRPFNLAKTEVTQAQWVAIMGSNPSNFKGDNNPVEQVSWDDVQRFISKLNQKEDKRYRLPSEAEWEYAARAGSSSAYCFGDHEGGLGQYTWYESNANERTHPVAEKKANSWGMFDMHGNVYEWVQDNWHRSYNGAPTDGSVWSGGDSGYRVIRGGSWLDYPQFLRSSYRYIFTPILRDDYIGFRLAQ